MPSLVRPQAKIGADRKKETSGRDSNQHRDRKSRQHRRHRSPVANDYGRDDQECDTVSRRLFLPAGHPPSSPRQSPTKSEAVQNVGGRQQQKDKTGREAAKGCTQRTTKTAMSPPSKRPARDSVLSAVSMASMSTTTSTGSTTRRFWSPSPSSPPSPISTSPTLTPGTSEAPSTVNAVAATGAQFMTGITSNQVVTYIPPLVDAAGGTVGRSQQASAQSMTVSEADSEISSRKTRRPLQGKSISVAYGLLRSDLRWIGSAIPELLGILWTKSMMPLLAVFAPRVWARPLTMPLDTVADAAEVVLQISLAVFEISALAVSPVLFLCLPGGLFLAWLAVCVFFARVLSLPLNSGSSAPMVYDEPWSVDKEDAKEVEDDEHWFFVSGMGATSRSLAKTVPRLAAVFGRPITVVRPGRTYGAAADFLCALVQRILPSVCTMPSPGAGVLYTEIRDALLARGLSNPDQRRIVVLAHNTGAAAVSQVLTRLLVHVPTRRLAQLEIYTFGSLAPDFILPNNTRVGKEGLDNSMSPLCNGGGPHIEHVAHIRDPCARFGVLRSVREELAVRYCGGVFVLGSSPSGLRRRVSHEFSSLVVSTASPAHRTQTDKQYRLSFPFSYRKRHHETQLDLRHRSVSSSSSFASDNSTEQNTERSSSALSFLGSALFGRSRPSQRALLSMEDYLIALFGPEPWSMRPQMEGDASLTSDAFFVDAEIVVDRELAEKREMTAMARNSCVESPDDDYRGSAERSQLKPRAAASLSWTGLGATVLKQRGVFVESVTGGLVET